MKITVKNEKLIINNKGKEVALGYFDAVKLRIELNKYINNELVEEPVEEENEVNNRRK
jgi:hypothetical protein